MMPPPPPSPGPRVDVERYRRARSIFDQVVDLDPVSRAAAVDVACGTDAALRALVVELVELDQVDSPLDDAGAAIAADIVRAAGGTSSLQPGDVVDRYVVESLLGTGGTARVWAVRHRTLGTRHALKVLSWSDATLRERLMREARTQARLVHPNIVPVRDIIELEGSPALLMPLIEGPPLDILLRQVRPTVDEATALLRGILAGVGHAHAEGFVHRDIKAANVLLDLHSGTLVPRVTDFGLVKATDAQTLTRPGDIMCTLAAAAPEQLHDPSSVDLRADIWSLGVVAYHLATGSPPFPGTTLAAVVEAHVTGPDLDRVPAALRPLVAAALQADPTDRAGSAEALAALLPQPSPSFDPARLLHLAQRVQAGEDLRDPSTQAPAHLPLPPATAPTGAPHDAGPPPAQSDRPHPAPTRFLPAVIAAVVSILAVLAWHLGHP